MEEREETEERVGGWGVLLMSVMASVLKTEQELQ